MNNAMVFQLLLFRLPFSKSLNFQVSCYLQLMLDGNIWNWAKHCNKQSWRKILRKFRWISFVEDVGWGYVDNGSARYAGDLEHSFAKQLISFLQTHNLSTSTSPEPGQTDIKDIHIALDDKIPLPKQYN